MGLATSLLIAGTAASVGGQISAGQKQSQAEKFNASISDQQAESVLQQGTRQANLQRRRGESFVSTQRARYGASGVTASGSPLEVMAQTAEDVEYDALMTEWESKTKAQYYKAEAENRRRAGKKAITDSYIGAGMTLLTSAASYGMAQGFGSGASKVSPSGFKIHSPASGAKFGMLKF